MSAPNFIACEVTMLFDYLRGVGKDLTRFSYVRFATTTEPTRIVTLHVVRFRVTSTDCREFNSTGSRKVGTTSYQASTYSATTPRKSPPRFHCTIFTYKEHLLLSHELVGLELPKIFVSTLQIAVVSTNLFVLQVTSMVSPTAPDPHPPVLYLPAKWVTHLKRTITAILSSTSTTSTRSFSISYLPLLSCHWGHS